VFGNRRIDDVILTTFVWPSSRRQWLRRDGVRVDYGFSITAVLYQCSGYHQSSPYPVSDGASESCPVNDGILSGGWRLCSGDEQWSRTSCNTRGGHRRIVAKTLFHFNLNADGLYDIRIIIYMYSTYRVIILWWALC